MDNPNVSTGNFVFASNIQRLFAFEIPKENLTPKPKIFLVETSGKILILWTGEIESRRVF